MPDNDQSKDELIAQLREENRLLKEKIDYLIKVIHGSRSEKLNAGQLELLLDPDAAKKSAAAEPEDLGPAVEPDDLIARPRQPVARKPRLPENIPTTEVVLIPDEVKANPDAYRQVGEKRSEKLDVTPARYTRRVIIRPTYIQRGEPIPSWITAPAPVSLLEGSILTSSLAAHILTAKFCDHMPFYRQEQIMARRHGIHIPRSTLCHWADHAAQTLEPLYKLIAQDIRKSKSISVDETPVDYLPKEEQGSKQGYFWVYYSEQAGVLYDWQTGRGHECLDSILISGAEKFSGQLQCDGYSAYQTWANKRNDVTLLGCWAHARRKFHEALPHSKDAALVLQVIQQLYRDEHRFKEHLAKGKHPPEAIIYLRRRTHRKLLQRLRVQLLQLRSKHLPKSKMGAAIQYALNQWHKLQLAHKHAVRLDNNICENAVRPLKLGAKNWLFVGNEDTGWRSAVIYTFIENIRREGLDPFAYLQWVFEKIPHMTNRDDLRELLPKAWVERQKQDCQNAPTLVKAA
jgi:transposase